MDVVKERSGLEFRAEFHDAFNAPTVPVSVHWRLDCETTGNAIVDWTEVTPDITLTEQGITDVFVTINVPSLANAMQKSTNQRELKTLLVVAAKDTDRELPETYQYYVLNLRGRH